ncbi:hypothetical protein GCM10011341_26640 [Frigidibacter albus]|nr:hypothetical protein GCM10011341_26640 [Frigidibacter albus]
MEFQAPQASQRPAHFLWTAPQAVQVKVEEGALAMAPSARAPPPVQGPRQGTGRARPRLGWMRKMIAQTCAKDILCDVTVSICNTFRPCGGLREQNG